MANELSGFGALSVSIGADATEFTAALKKSEAEARTWGQKVSASFSSFGKSLGSSLLGSVKSIFSIGNGIKALAGLVGIGGLGLLVKSSLDTADALNAMAQRAQMSTRDLQALNYVASQTNLSVEGLETGLKFLNKQLGEATSGKRNIFSDLGISINAAGGAAKSQIDLIKELADKYNAASTAGERMLILQKAFGKSGQAWAGAFEGGSQAIDALIKEAERLGLILDDHLLKGADSAKDAFQRLAMVLNAQLMRIILTLAPALERWATAFANAAPEIERVANAIMKFLFGVNAMSLSGLRAESQKLEAEISDIDRRAAVVAQSIRDRGGRDAEARAQAAIEQGKRASANLKAQLAALQEQIKKAEEDSKVKPPTFGDTTYGTLGGGEGKTDRMKEFIQSLRDSAQAAAYEAKEREILEAVLKAEAIARDENRTLTDAERESVERLVRFKQEAVEYEKLMTKAREEGKAVTEAVRTPAEAYAAEVERLTWLLNVGAIQQETFNRAVAKAKETFEETTPEGKRLEQAAYGITNAFEKTAEAAFDMGADIGTVFEQFLKDIAKVILQLYILGPLMENIGKMMKGIMGGGGFSFSSIFGSGGGGGISDTSWIEGYLGFASGGSFTVGGVGGTDSQLTAIRTTPGEIVNVKRPGWDTNGGGNVTVIVNNNSKAGVKTQEGRDEQGNPSIEILIEEIVAKGMGRPGSRINQAAANTFGMRNVLARR